MQLWTIGHSNQPLRAFLAALAACNIALIADVRRFPASRRHPHFSKDAPAIALNDRGIGYEYCPELGGRRPVQKHSRHTAWQNAGFRGYAGYMETQAFHDGIARLLKAAAERRSAVMCAELLCWQCHRGRAQGAAVLRSAFCVLRSDMFLIALFALGVLSGATAAVVGFGIGSLLTPLLLTRLAPPVAIAAVALPHLAATALRYVQHRHAVNKPVLVKFGVASALGGFTGAWLQAALDEKGLFIVLGGLLIATAIANLTGTFGGWEPPATVAISLGALSGLFGGLVGNQGGLRAAGLLAFDLPKRAYLATGTAVALLIDAARTPVYLARAGTDLIQLALPIAVATGGCVLGTVLGERVFLGLAPQRYQRIVGVAVGVLGIWLLARALTPQFT